jgi:hypothetical protein
MLNEKAINIISKYPIKFARVYYSNNINNAQEYWDYNKVFYKWISQNIECINN